MNRSKTKVSKACPLYTTVQRGALELWYEVDVCPRAAMHTSDPDQLKSIE